MARYRIKVEAMGSEKEGWSLWALTSEEGYVCDGFVIMGNHEDNSGEAYVHSLSPVDLALLFTQDDVLVAAAKAGEALQNVIKARKKEDIREKLGSLKNLFGDTDD